MCLPYCIYSSSDVRSSVSLFPRTGFLLQVRLWRHVAPPVADWRTGARGKQGRVDWPAQQRRPVTVDRAKAKDYHEQPTQRGCRYDVGERPAPRRQLGHEAKQSALMPRQASAFSIRTQRSHAEVVCRGWRKRVSMSSAQQAHRSSSHRPKSARRGQLRSRDSNPLSRTEGR